MPKWIVSSNGITADEVVMSPKSVKVGDVLHPSQVFQLWSEQELNASHIYCVNETTAPVSPGNYVGPPEYVRSGTRFAEQWPITPRPIDSLRAEGTAKMESWQSATLQGGVVVNGVVFPSDTQSGFRAMLALQSGGENASITMTAVNGTPATLNAAALQAYTSALHDLQEMVDSKVRSATQTISVSTTYQQIEAAVAALDA